MAGDWYTPLFSDIKTGAAASWPDVTRFFRVMQIQRVHWLNEIIDKRLAPPFGIIQIPRAAREPGYGAQVVYRVQVNLFYVGLSNGIDYEGTLFAKLIQAQDYFLSHSWSFTLLDDEIAFDTSEDNPANMVLQEGNLPYVAGSFSFSCLTGIVT